MCREGRRPRWPFADISNRSGEVSDLYSLVNKIIRVFSHAGPSELKVFAVPFSSTYRSIVCSACSSV